MKAQINLTLDTDLMYSKEIYELTKTRRLSKLVNNLLRSFLNLKDTNVSKIDELENEKKRLELEISNIKIKQEEEKRNLVKEASKWREVEFKNAVDWKVRNK